MVRELVEALKGESFDERDILMNLIHELQKRYGNHVPVEVLEEVARELDIPLSKLNEVVSFYTMFSFKKRGRHIVRVCRSTPCHVAGGREVVEELKRVLKIDFGQTTEDGLFTLEWSGCLGLCGVGPVMMIDNDFYGNLKPEDIAPILERYRGGER